MSTVADVLEGRARWVLVEGDCLAVLPMLPDRSVGHVITDPPYSDYVHAKGWRGATLGDARGDHAGGATSNGACFARARELGFDAITQEGRGAVARQAARLVRRWSLLFCDVESSGNWRTAVLGAGLQHIRVGLWIKLGATPQFTGDRPATGAEAIEIAHPKGRKKWNGGGTHAVWTHAIELNRGGVNARVHTTQKPLPLMLELVELFTDPDDLVLDPFAGSGTTGVACLRLGRRFIGIEKDPTYAAVARERLEAETQGLSLRDARAGQIPMFPVTP